MLVKGRQDKCPVLFFVADTRIAEVRHFFHKGTRKHNGFTGKTIGLIGQLEKCCVSIAATHQQNTRLRGSIIIDPGHDPLQEH
jgi:hypothetical protein